MRTTSGDPVFDESFEFQLSAGWNMVSFPNIPVDPSFSHLLSDLTFYQLYTWDGSSYISPSDAEPGRGYWLWVPEDTTLAISNGEPINSFELDLLLGWSIIGSIFPCTVDAGLVFPSFYQLYTWDGSSYVSSTIIEPGKSYWVFVPEATHIVVDESCSVQTNNPPQADYLQILHEPPSTVSFGETHECRMWGMIAETLPSTIVMDHLVNFPESLKRLGGELQGNDDGWGLVNYSGAISVPTIQRGSLAASWDPNFNLAAQTLADSDSIIGMGHVRDRSSGASGIPNPHPFVRERGGRLWSFEHNGGASKNTLYNLIGDEYLYQYDPPSYAPTGWHDPYIVDSDLYMIWVLKNIEENGWDVISGIAVAVTELGARDSGSHNFLFSDGEKLWGFKDGYTLYYKESVEGYSSIVSQPPEGTQSDWITMSDYNLVELSTDAAPVLISDIRTLYPPAYDSLTATYAYYDEDGDPESGSEIRWYRDDILQSDFNDAVTVPSDSTADGEEWFFTVRPSDGEDFGVLKTSPTVTIGDTVVGLFENVELTAVDLDIANARWMDVADQTYSADYINSYDYSQATVNVTYYTLGASFHGTLKAANLKPNFAYQLKFVGTPGTVDNERIGLVGRWWQEEWNGTAWDNGWNLNDKGNGSSPNPNDLTYIDKRYQVNASSPTGYHYRYTGYLLFDYFITDSHGYANLEFETGNSYHVLWKTSQGWPYTEDDGPIKSRNFDPDTSEIAYDIDYPSNTVGIFGEWERLPMGNTSLNPGEYSCTIVLTEESFHGSGGSLSGNWVTALKVGISFKIVL